MFNQIDVVTLTEPKHCRVCRGEIKVGEEAFVESNKSDGTYYICKDCHIERGGK